MKELSEASGLPVATIKFCVREGLLHPGHATSATQATYDETHLARLRLVRALRELGEMPLARIEVVLAAIDDERTPLSDLLAQAHHALGPEPLPPTPALTTARTEVLAFVDRRGWRVATDAPAIDLLAGALSAVRDLWVWPDCGADVFDDYADVAERIAAHELGTVDPTAGRGETVRQIVTGTVVFERALVALRRLAEEHHSRLRFDEPPPTSGRARRSPAGRARTPAPER